MTQSPPSSTAALRPSCDAATLAVAKAAQWATFVREGVYIHRTALVTPPKSDAHRSGAAATDAARAGGGGQRHNFPSIPSPEVNWSPPSPLKRTTTTRGVTSDVDRLSMLPAPVARVDEVTFEQPQRPSPGTSRQPSSASSLGSSDIVVTMHALVTPLVVSTPRVEITRRLNWTNLAWASGALLAALAAQYRSNKGIPRDRRGLLLPIVVGTLVALCRRLAIKAATAATTESRACAPVKLSRRLGTQLVAPWAVPPRPAPLLNRGSIAIPSGELFDARVLCGSTLVIHISANWPSTGPPVFITPAMLREVIPTRWTPDWVWRLVFVSNADTEFVLTAEACEVMAKWPVLCLVGVSSSGTVELGGAAHLVNAGVALFLPFTSIDEETLRTTVFDRNPSAGGASAVDEPFVAVSRGVRLLCGVVVMLTSVTPATSEAEYPDYHVTFVKAAVDAV